MLKSLFSGNLPKAVFFDLDGTLIDSLPDLTSATDAMLTDLDFESAGLENVRSWVGNGAEKLVQRALANAKNCVEESIKSNELSAALNIFLEKYAGYHGQHSKTYPGVMQTLHALQDKGLRLCVITNKPEQFTPGVLAKHKLTNFFELVLSGDSLKEKKPSPLPILYALKKFNLEKSQAVMVGDSHSDIMAANSAGIKSVCVSYGYNHGNDPKKLPADAHIDAFPQLLD